MQTDDPSRRRIIRRRTSPTSGASRPLLAGAAVVVVETLVGIADVRRPLFLAVSALAGLLCLVMAGWYFFRGDRIRAAAAAAGIALVGCITIFGSPSSTQLTGPVVTPKDHTLAVAPVSGTYDEAVDEVVVEEPSEAEALFGHAIDITTPWYNDVVALFPGTTVEDAEGEAALLGTWWALSDWCVDAGNGNAARCYDLAALYLAQTFDRDPRSISDDNWFQPGAIGALLSASYDVTAGYVNIKGGFEVLNDFSRPGIAWDCEPTCTAAAARGDNEVE